MMKAWARVLYLIGLKPALNQLEHKANYYLLLQESLIRARLAEQQIREAKTLEELDIGRSTLSAARAEIQQIIRIAKHERGITLRPVSETEKIHRQLIRFMNRHNRSRQNVIYPQSPG